MFEKGKAYMSRIEKVREVVDSVLEAMTDPEERRCAYIHLYGVAQAAALIAGKRKENMELSIVAAMLHDLYAKIWIRQITRTGGRRWQRRSFAGWRYSQTRKSN